MYHTNGNVNGLAFGLQQAAHNMDNLAYMVQQGFLHSQQAGGGSQARSSGEDAGTRTLRPKNDLIKIQALDAKSLKDMMERPVRWRERSLT